jgi:hypothetical protein
MYRRPNRLIIAQYQAPKNLSLLAAAELLGDGKRAAAAQVIDLVVRKVLAIKRVGKGFRLTLLTDPSGEGPDQLEFVTQLFGGGALRPGLSSVNLAKGRNKQLGQRLRGPQRGAIARLIAGGYAQEQSLWSKLLTPWRKQPIEPTAKGEPIVDHLWGIHDYVQLAEQERFRVLQSPDGAVPDALQQLVLNEKLLPYAVLFNLEKQWMQQLDLQYRDLPPDLAADLEDLLVIVDAVAVGIEVVGLVVDIATLVDATNALEGAGAVFGGIGEVLSNLPDIDLPDLG